MKGEKFCHYCRTFKAGDGFKFIFSVSLTKRLQCPSCQATRKLSREKLREMAEQESLARRQQMSVLARNNRERNKNE